MKISLPNDKLGFYTVNGKKFYGKIEALLHANDTLADIEWNFNKEIFDAINWTVEPETSLLELYKQRAQQLRDEYDYIIVMASGGADSTNVIYSFLKNGIHIDEIVISAPISGLANYQWNDKDLHANNTISETKFAQFPLADEIRTQWPNVKVTLNDYFQEMLDYKSDDWMMQGSYWIHPTCSRYSLDKQHHIKNLAESGKKIAKVFGLDKPVLVRGPNGMLFNTILDTVCQVGNHKTTREEYPNLETVYFYFSPEMPQLMVKQSHVLAKWMHMPENAYARSTMADIRANAAWNLNEHRFSLHHRANISCVYPMLEGRKVFQTDKSFQNFTNIAFDNWFYKLHGETRLSQMIQSDFNVLKSKINKKYFNELNNAFAPHVQRYFIGHESKFILDKERFKLPGIDDMDPGLI
jgi:hypothetical protein